MFAPVCRDIRPQAYKQLHRYCNLPPCLAAEPNAQKRTRLKSAWDLDEAHKYTLTHTQAKHFVEEVALHCAAHWKPPKPAVTWKATTLTAVLCATRWRLLVARNVSAAPELAVDAISCRLLLRSSPPHYLLLFTLTLFRP